MKRVTFLKGGKYFATKDGKIFTANRGPLREFKQQTNRKGYKHVRLCGEPGKQSSYFVSRIIYRVFVGEIADGMQIDHIDNNPANNSLSNLRTVTNRDNQVYKFENIKKQAPNSTCPYCKTPFYAYNVKKYCSPYCQKKTWRLAYRQKHGAWV